VEPGFCFRIGREALLRSIIWSAVLLSCGAGAGFAQSGDPTIDPNLGVQNQGNFKAGEPVAAGSFVAIFGTNFASSLTLADTIPLSNSLANVSVTFNNVPAPMVAVGHDVNSAHDDQINAQMPWNVLSNGATSGAAQVVVTRGSVSSAQGTVMIVPVAPGLLIAGQDSAGVLRPVVYHNSDSALAYPANAFPGGSPSRPAKLSDPNDALVLLATGLGAVDSTPPNGQPPPLVNGMVVLDNTKVKPIIMVGGVAATVLFSGLSPQFPSLYQVNFMLDPNTPTGDMVPVVIIDPTSRLQSRTDLMISITR
jgi:uncharacterized protein (TIGR03437 family)